VELKDVALQSPTWFDEQCVRLITQSTVAAIRTGEGAVELDGGTVIAADAVVLATGGQAARPPIPGADDPHVHTLRTAEDAD
ncbi:FAD-dependent oxidoreductase, partial [Salmonella enterica subsp. enterica serovar Stanley]